MKKAAPSFMPWAGRSTRLGRRSSALRPCRNCCLAMWDAPAVASTRCADTPTFRAQPTWRAFSISLPGYLKVPTPADTDFDSYINRITPTPSKPKEWDSFNYWSNTPKFAVSSLKAMYGDAAKKENDWAFHYLPKIDRKYSWVEHVGQHVQRARSKADRLWDEWRRHWSELEEEH